MQSVDMVIDEEIGKLEKEKGVSIEEIVRDADEFYSASVMALAYKSQKALSSEASKLAATSQSNAKAKKAEIEGIKSRIVILEEFKKTVVSL